MTELEESLVVSAALTSGAASAAAAMATTVGYQVLTQIKQVLRTSFGTLQDANQETDSKEGVRWPDLNDSAAGGVVVEEAELKEYTLHEISFHDSPDDCWMVVFDLVYDVTDFLFEHPGGEDVMLEYAGRDATLAFRSVGHSKAAERALKPYLVGRLPEHERMWFNRRL